MQELPEILLIDKPAGITSFDVIRQLRKKTGIKKFGHAGTLDPLATGLMIIGVQSGTKKLTDYIKLDKEYIAEIRIGEKRSTGDLEGIILEERDVEVAIPEETIIAELQALVGKQVLPVSAYSAIKKDGKPMYKRAREAEKVGDLIDDVPLREMNVYETELLKSVLENKRQVVTVRFFVGSGTYIRSLAEALGNQLGYPATLQSLRRTKVGEFKIKDAKRLADI